MSSATVSDTSMANAERLAQLGSPELKEALHIYKFSVAVAESIDDVIVRNARILEAKNFLLNSVQKHSVPQDSSQETLTKLLESANRRKLYPGSQKLDLNRNKEHLFDTAYDTPSFREDMMTEFYQKAQAGQLEPLLVVFVGALIAVGGPYERDTMEKRVYRLLHMWMREPAATQCERYNFYKMAEYPEEMQLSYSAGVPYMTFPLFPVHPLTQARNGDLFALTASYMNTQGYVVGGSAAGEESEEEMLRKRAKSFYKNSARTLWGSGYSAPVMGFDGQQVGVADLSDVEAQFNWLCGQVQRLSEQQTKTLGRAVNRRITMFEQAQGKTPKPKTAPVGTKQDKQSRIGRSRVHRGGAASDQDEDGQGILDELFPSDKPLSKNGIRASQL